MWWTDTVPDSRETEDGLDACARGALEGIWVMERPHDSHLDGLLLALLRLSMPVSCPFCCQDHRPPGPQACESYREVARRIGEEWVLRYG